MASTQATIDLIVKGSAAVNKLINDVNQLQGAVSRINSQTLDIAPEGLRRSANRLSSIMDRYSESARGRRRLVSEETRLLREVGRIREDLAAQERRADEATDRLARRRANSRTRRDSREETRLRQQLDDATGQMESLTARSNETQQSLQRVRGELSEIGRLAGNSIQAATRLVDENRALTAAASIRQLAREYNSFGDSLRRSTRESLIAQRDIPRLETRFAELRHEVSQSRRAIADLERTIDRLGPVEIPIEITAPRDISADLLTGALPSLSQVAGEAEERNNAIRRRNEERQAAQAALEQARENLANLERRAADTGASLVARQGQLNELIQSRTLEVGPSGTSNRTGLSVSLNQLQAQAEALTLVANNSSIASNAFNQFTIAAEMASIKLAKAQQSTFSALAAGFSSALPVPPGLGQQPGRPDPIAGARAEVAELIAMIPSLTRSEAALSAHIASLTKVKQLLPFISSEYQAVEGAINSLNDELQQAKSPIATRLGSREQFMQQYQFQVKRLKEADAAVNKQVDLEDKINRAKVDSVTKAKLLESTNRVLQAIDEDRLERARQITRESERQLRAAVDLANENRKKPKAGVYRSDQISPIQGPYILRNAIASGEIVEQSLRNLADRGADVQGRLASLQTILNKAKSGQFEISSKNLGVLVQEVGLAGKYAQLQQKVLQGKAREERVNKLAQEMLSSKQKELDAMERIDKIRQGGVSDEGVQASIKAAEELAQENDKLLRGMRDKAKVSREADDLAKKQADAQAALPNQITKLKILQGEYNKAKERGAQISQEEFDKLGKLLDKISDPGFKTSPLARKDIDYLTQRLDLLRQLRLAEKPSKTKEGAAGPASPVADLALQTKYQRQLNDLYKDQDALLENIGKARIGQEQRERLLFSVDMAREALLTHRLEDSQDITKEVAKQLKIEQEISDLQTRQRAKHVNWMTTLSRGEEIIAENRTKSDNSLAEEREKSGKRLANQLIELQTLQSNYAGLEARGVKFLEEKAQLTDLVNSLVAKQVPLTKQSADFVGEEIRRLRLYTQLRASQAKTAGTLITPSKARTPEQLEDQRKRLLDSAQGLEAKVYGLEQKGVLLAGTRLGIEEEILNLKKMQGNATADSLRSSGEFISDIRRTLNQIGREMAMGVPGAGLAAGLKSLGQARGGREGFLGSLSPAEAIDKIVREFNNGGAFASASTSAGKSGKNVVDTFAKNIKNGAPAAADASRAMAEASTQAINDVYGIASPARFMILLVKNLVDTYVREMQKAGPRIKAATERAFGDEGLLRAGRYNPFQRSSKSPVGPYSADPQTQPASQAMADASRSAAAESAQKQLDRREQRIQQAYLRSQARGRDVMVEDALSRLGSQRQLPAVGFSSIAESERRRLDRREQRIQQAYLRSQARGRDVMVEDAFSGLGGQRSLPAIGFSPIAESAQKQLDRREQRIRQAYLRSEARGRAIEAEDALGGSGRQRLLPAANLGFMADPARIRRLSGIGRALPPSTAEPRIDIAPPTLATEPSKRSRAAAALKQSIAGYREAVDNFWEGEDSQFSAVTKILKASANFTYAKIRRRLTETRSGLEQLPSVVEPAQEQLGQQGRRIAQRIEQAYLRSEARGLAVMAESAFGRSGGPRPLPAGDFGFMADPARIRRIYRRTIGIDRALPPAAAEPGASAAPPALATEPSKRSRAAAELKQSIANYRKAADNFLEGEGSIFSAFTKMLKAEAGLAYSKIKRRLTETRSNAAEQIADSVASDVTAAVGQATAGASSAAASQGVAGGGVAGGGGRPPAGPAGAGKDPEDFARRLSSAADQGAEALLTLKELRDPASASINELEALSSVLKEFRGVLDPTAEGFDRLDNQLRETIAGLDRMSQVRAPDAEFLTRLTRDPRKAAAISEGLIGGAFPLLFGQGIGASAGGLIGGAAGGFAGGGLGFGLSLAGTAIGTAVDTFIANLSGLAKSLDEPTTALEAMKTAGLTVNKDLERNVRLLEESGQAYKAQSLVLAEIERQLGAGTVKQLNVFKAEQKELESQFSRLAASLTGQLIPALTGATVVINDLFSFVAKAYATIPEPLKKLQLGAAVGLFAGPTAGMAAVQGVDILSQVGRDATNQNERPSAELAKQLQTEAMQHSAATKELAGQVSLEQKRLSLMGISLEKNAQAYGQKAKEVALQELENRLLEIKDSWIGKIFDKERNSLMIKQAYIKYQQEERQINQQVAEAQKQANQRNIDDLNRLLSLRSQIAQTGLSTLDARIEYKRLVDGELAAAEMATNSLELRTELQRTILELETSQALSNSQLTEREKQLLNDIYDRKIFLLKAEHAIKWRISMTDEARLRTEEKIAKLNRERSIEDIVQTRDQELSGLRARLDLPFNEDKLAEVNLQLEQASRLYQTLTPLQRELKDMQIKREDRAGVVSKKELEMLDADIESVKLKISLESQYLEAISETEKALLRQQQIYSRYQPLASTIAGAFTSSFGQIATGASTAQQALAAFLQGTADAFLDMASRIIAKWIEMTILNSIMKLFPGNPAAAIGPIAKTDWGGGGGGLFGNLGANDWEGAPGIGTGLTGPANPLKFANGGMFTNSIVSSPTLFKFADGAAMKTGVMGEAGAEAVMPLTRGPGGRLGVDASGAGGGDITVNVSVDATGSRVQGDDAQSAELGRLIGAAVHQEMLKQKRPGGLLAS